MESWSLRKLTALFSSPVEFIPQMPPDAGALAQGKPLELIDGEQLCRLIEPARVNASPLKDI